MTARHMRVDEELVSSLVNRISWVAFVLAPLSDTATQIGRWAADAVAELDHLVERVRLLPQSKPLELSTFVSDLRSVHDRLGECWVLALAAGGDAYRAERLASACRLVRGILISLQPGALPPAARAGAGDLQ